MVDYRAPWGWQSLHAMGGWVDRREVEEGEVEVEVEEEEGREG